MGEGRVLLTVCRHNIVNSHETCVYTVWGFIRARAQAYVHASVWCMYIVHV